MLHPMKFCSLCGASLRLAIPDGDDRPRHLCDACDTVHYQNPKLIAGCIPVWQDRILLCKRAIDPRKGFWTLPAGFMEMGETIAQAAQREAREEANVEVAIGEIFTIFSLPHISQVYFFFRAEMITEDFSSGAESLETRLFREDEIPWDDLSFETVQRSLRFFLDDRKTGQFKLRIEDIARDPRRMRER
jgi:ADP-ribose pyrophosphatase YjhB (NUDIX family)